MAKIQKNPYHKGAEEKERKATKIQPEDFEKVRAQLGRGETLRKDGTLMYRPTKADYDGGIPVSPIYANSIEELRSKERQLLSRLDRRLNAIQSKATVDDLFQKWCSIKKDLLRTNTFNNYEYMYRHFVLGTKFGRSRAVTVKKSDILMLYNNLIGAHNISVSTLDSLQNVLHQMFALLKDDDIIPSNPTENALCQIKKSTKLGKSERVALSVPEQYLFFHYLFTHEEESRWKRLLTVMLGTGLRIGELAGLRWCDIDFTNGIIRVEHSLVNFPHPGQKPSCTYEMHDPKTEAGYRSIPMLSFVREMLEEERAWQNETGEHSTMKVDGYDNFVFFNRFGQPHHQGTVNKAIRRIIRDCNQEIMMKTKEKNPVLVPPFSCHILRHTCATRLIESGRINPIVVQGYMGHASLDTTMDVYVNATEYFKRKTFGLEKGKDYPNIFDEALKDLGADAGAIPPQSYSSSISHADSSRLMLKDFSVDLTQKYTENTQNDLS